MRKLLRLLLFVSLLLPIADVSISSAHERTVKNVVAQAGAGEIVSRLEQQLLSNAAIKMQFSLKTGDRVSIVADTKRPRVRIDSKALTIVSDGSTVWNYRKDQKQLTIDNLSNSKASALRSPQDLFKFAENYTTKLLSTNGKEYVLELTPKGALLDLLKTAGNITKLTLTVQDKGKSLMIKKASVEGSTGTTEAGGVTIQGQKLQESTFHFATPQGAKIIDLRE